LAGFRIPASPLVAMSSAVVQFWIIVLFIGLGPVSTDRSISIYLLGTMGNQPEHVFSVAELEDRLIKNYVRDYGAVERRLAEQVASRNIEPDDDGYRLTRQGTVVVQTMKAVGWIFNVDRRFIDPVESQPMEGKSERTSPTVR
jgi:hypothetical protein